MEESPCGNDICQDSCEGTNKYICRKIPLTSCMEVKEFLEKQSLKPESGPYAIKIGQQSGTVYCEMDTLEGGWLRVANVDIQSGDNSNDITLEAPLSLVFNNTGNYVLSVKAMQQLRAHMTIKQMLFYCHKVWSGVTFHVVTANNSTGQAVVNYFTNVTNEKPGACGSFQTLPDDTSYMASHCQEWFGNTWHIQSLGRYIAYVQDKSKLVGFDSNEAECDDYKNADKDYTPAGNWMYFVR